MRILIFLIVSFIGLNLFSIEKTCNGPIVQEAVVQGYSLSLYQEDDGSHSIFVRLDDWEYINKNVEMGPKIVTLKENVFGKVDKMSKLPFDYKRAKYADLIAIAPDNDHPQGIYYILDSQKKRIGLIGIGAFHGIVVCKEKP